METSSIERRMALIHSAVRNADYFEKHQMNQHQIVEYLLNGVDVQAPSKYFDWCSLFMMYVTGISPKKQMIDLAARSWLRIGKRKNNPIIGDVVVYWREAPESWKGHVGLFVGMEQNKILTLGGNQSSEVNITPMNPYFLVSYIDIMEVLP